jgi:hypothetical protein
MYYNVPNNDFAFQTIWSSTTTGSILLYDTSAAARLSVGGPACNISCFNLNPLSCNTLNIGGSDCYYHLFKNTGRKHGERFRFTYTEPQNLKIKK